MTKVNKVISAYTSPILDHATGADREACIESMSEEIQKRMTYLLELGGFMESDEIEEIFSTVFASEVFEDAVGDFFDNNEAKHAQQQRDDWMVDQQEQSQQDHHDYQATTHTQNGRPANP